MRGSAPRGALSHAAGCVLVVALRLHCRTAGAQEMDVEISDIAMACGSGGTTAGIGAGMQLSGYPARCHGYMVCDNARYFSQHADTVIFPGMAGSGDGAAALSPAAELITFQ